MISVGTGYSKNRHPEKAAESATKMALDKAKISNASAVVVFATADHRQKYPSILKKISEIAKTDNITGASGYGVLTEEVEIEVDCGIAVMVMASDEIEAQSFFVPNLQESSLKAGEQIGRMLREKKSSPSLLMAFPDTFSFRSPQFFDGLESTYGYIPIVGGTCSEDGTEDKTHQLYGQQSAFDAISGLVLSGNLRSEIGITRTCLPFGEPVQVTRANGNLIYEINGRPAYDIFLESVSQVEFENPNQIFQRVFLGFPVRNFQTDFMDSPYLLYNIMGANQQKGFLTCGAHVEQGEFVTFAIRDAERARQDMQMMLQNLQQRVEPSQPYLGFYINCCARGQVLYGRPQEDTAWIRHHFPDVPIIGFFSYGEMAPVDHVNHLHHYSGVLTLLCSK